MLGCGASGLTERWKMGLQTADSQTLLEAPKAKCVVRPARAEDMTAVASIYSPFVEKTTATFELTAPDEAEVVRRWKAVMDRGLPYLVAELDGYVVGYCYASQFRPREGYRLTVEDSIYVRSDCIGYGVGRSLLSALIAECKARGCHSMVACICGVNLASTALHESLGFRVVGLLPEAGLKFGEWLRLCMMQRLLSEKRSLVCETVD